MRVPVAVVSLALAMTACWPAEPSRSEQIRAEVARRQAAAAAESPHPGDEGAPAPRRLRKNVGGEPQVVLLMVLDTVRADHTSLCGYDRPTTPSLQALQRLGASTTCQAYAPAPWTLPSHASYFTGKSVQDHATMFVANSDVSINATITARPLSADFETLAETFRARGYQTLAISGNSILNEPSGLLQGFDVKNVSTNGMSLRGRALGNALREALATMDKERPLFVFVNSYDAHDPYPAVPPGLDWLPPQPRGRLDAYTKDPKNPYFAFIKGLMPEAEQPPFLRGLTDTYDFGVAYADAQVGVIVGTLNKEGWMNGGYRLLITSDHGEFLGEHGLLRHCGFVWEPVVRVPMVFVDSTRRTKFVFPEPLSAIHAYHLVRDGHLPDALIPPHTISEKNPDDILVGTIAGAVWGADGKKAVCVEGASSAYDLRADPSEAHPLPLSTVDGGPMPGDLRSVCEGIEALHRLPVPSVDASLTAALKAMGYASDDEAPTMDLPPKGAKGILGE